jgi:hypothetical protein
MRVIMALLVGLASLVPLPASAFAFCSEPSEPSCVDGSGYFDDQDEFERCKSEVESYISDKEYAECLANERNEAIDAANRIVEKFNCRAEGRSIC